MENDQNAPMTNTTPASTAPSEQQPPVNQPVVEQKSPQPSSGFNFKILWVFGAVLLVVSIVLGVILYTQSQEKAKDKVVSSGDTQTITDIESEASSIEIGEVDSAFKEIDQDLSGL